MPDPLRLHDLKRLQVQAGYQLWSIHDPGDPYHGLRFWMPEGVERVAREEVLAYAEARDG